MMIETTFSRHRKSCGPGLRPPSATLQFACKILREKPFDRSAALRRLQVSARHHLAIPANGQKLGLLLEMRPEAGQPLVPRQHQKYRLRHPGGRGRVEAAGAVLDGIAAIGGSVWPTPKATRSSAPGVRPLTG